VFFMCLKVVLDKVKNILLKWLSSLNRGRFDNMYELHEMYLMIPNQLIMTYEIDEEFE